MKILIVDYVHKHVETLIEWLQQHGHDTTSAYNWKDASNILINQSPTPHMILINSFLVDEVKNTRQVATGTEAWEMIHQIRSSPDLTELPYIVVLSHKDEKDKGMRRERALCYEFGANSYFGKPVTEGQLFESLEKAEEMLKQSKTKH